MRYGDRPQPNITEVRWAGELARSLTPYAIAQALADAREGATMPGERRRVAAEVTVSTQVVRRSSGDAMTHARRGLRRAWVDKLHHEGMRPCGWPPITEHGVRFDGMNVDGPLREVPLEHADLIVLRIEGDAAPEDGA